MPASINGFGTTFYGQAEVESDGSFITTTWFILCFIPIVPLASNRLRPLEKPGFFSFGSEYVVVHELPINFLQVIKTWAYAALLFFALSTVMGGKPSSPWRAAFVIGVMLLPLILRLIAKAKPVPRQVVASKQRLSRPAPTPVAVSNCPKCHYRRKPEDEAPAWQCPNCKVAYNKVMGGNGF